MVKRTRAEALETRNVILDTAEQVFNEKGVSRTSLAEIADAAGMTRGAIYWHFRNKSDLFTAMCDRIALPMEEMVEQATRETVSDPLGSIRLMCEQVLKRPAQDAQCRRVFEILFHKCEYVDEMAETLTRQLECRTTGVAMLERAFRHAIKLGQLPAHLNARRAANGLACYIDGVIYNWLLNPDCFNLAKDASSLVDQYLRGLQATPAVRAGTHRSRGKPGARALRAA